MENKKQSLITVRGSKGKGSHTSFEADDNMFARQHAAFIDAISEGPIKGLVYGDASILVDEVRLRNVNVATGRIDSETNFNNFQMITKNGDAQQVVDADFFAEYPTASYVQSIGSAELLDNESQYHTISSATFEKSQADYIKITISTSGMSRIVKTGKRKGDIHTTAVYFTIAFSWTDIDGVARSENIFNTGFTGKVKGKFAHTFGFNIEDIKGYADGYNGMTDWAIKVTRLSSSPSSTDDNEVSNAIYVDSIEASIADKLEYPYTAYVGGIIDAENFSGVPSRGYEIDGKLINIPSNHFPIDYNGRKLTLSDAANFSVGDTLSQTLSVSSITSTGTAEEGYTATATVAAHGVNTGETFTATIATTASQDEDFFEGEFVCTAASATTFTYILNKPWDQTLDSGAGGYKAITSTTCTGTITAVMFSGGIVDKKVSNTLYVRNVAANQSALTGAISNGTHSGTVTGTEQIMIPANYRRNATTGALTSTERDWDGTFWNTWCNNPAWVYNDLITNKIYGLGNYLSQNQVNKWELYQIGRYCDELVPAGVEAADLLSVHCINDTNYTADTNQWEPRFSANLVINGKQEAYKVLNDVTSMFRGMTYWLNGEAYVVQDSEKDPVYQFTNGNVINGNFTYEGTANKTRTNSITVSWNNPQDYYRSRTEIVELEEVLQKDDEFIKPDSTAAFGCTSRGQARRLGKWKLLTNNWNTNTVSFSTSLNAAFLRPGDIIQVIDQHKEGKSWGGRVSTGSTTDDINIDRKPTGFGNTSVESGYAAGDYRLSLSHVGQKITFAQDTATIGSTGYVRGQDVPATLFTTIIIEDGGSGYDSGTTVAVSGNGSASLKIESGVITAVTVTQGTGYSSNPTLTIGNAGSGAGAVLTPYLSNTEIGSKNIKDDSGNLVFTQSAPFHYTETQTVSAVSNSGKTITTAAAFDSAPTQDSMWILSRAALATGKEKLEAKLFRIIELVENEGAVFDVKGIEYNATKFDAVDKNEALTKDRQIYLPDSFKTVPKVTNIDAEARIIAGGVDGGNINCIILEWDPALNSDGTLYNSVRSYSIEWSTDQEKWNAVGDTSNTSLEITDMLSDDYYFRIYTTSLNGVRSEIAESGSINIDFNRAVGPSEGTVGNTNWTINKIGNVSGDFSLDGGKVSFTPVNFLHNDGENEHVVTNQAVLDFTGLTGSNSNNNGANTGYVYFDHSADAFKAISHDEVSDNFYASGGTIMSTATGTLVADAGRATWTGLDSTNFIGDLGPDNVFKVVHSKSGSSTTYHHRVRRLTSDSVMTSYQPANFSLADSDNQAYSKPTFLADFNNDTIMGKVVKDGSGNYTLQKYGASQGESAYDVAATNENFTFDANTSGVVSNESAFSCDFTVKKGGQAYTYAASGTAQHTFGISLQARSGFDNDSDIVISGSGQITIGDGDMDAYTAATATMRLFDRGRSNLVIADKVLSFTKTSQGADGDAGAGSNFVFARAASKPNVPTADGLNIPSADIQWYDNPPSGTDLLWASKGTVAAGGTAYTWGTVFQVEGAAVAELKCYSDVVANNGSSPTKPSGSTYNVTNSTITLNDSNWNTAPPAVANDGDSIYQCTALVSGASTATALAITWTNPVLYQRKTDGGDGKQIQEIELYYELAAGSYTAPSTAPTTGAYTFSTGVVASIPTGWSQTKPSTKVGRITAASKALVTETSAGSDTSGTPSWSSPFLYWGGQPTVDYIFKYASSAPSAPSATSYPNLPTGWVTSIPTNPNDGKKLYSSKGVATLSGTYPNLNFNYTWQTPVVHTQTWSDVSGTSGAPADNATVGAVAGTNLKESDGTVMNDVDIRNEDLALDYSGTSIQLKKGGSQIGSNLSAPSGLLNSNVDKAHVGLSNVLNYAQVRLDLGNAPSGIVNSNVTKSSIGLGNVPNYTAATMMAQEFTGTLSSTTFPMASVITAANSAAVKSSLGYFTGAGEIAITSLDGYSAAAYANASVVATATVDGANTVTWSKYANGNFNPNTTTHTWSVTWKNGAGTTMATSTVVANLDTTNTDFDAPTITANASGSGVSSSVSGTGTTSQTITLSRSGFNDVVLKAVIYVVTGFSFKFNGE